LKIENIGDEKISGEERDFFFKNLHLGFGHKRKLLIGNLGNTYKKEKLIELFEKMNLNLKTRAENLDSNTWIALSKNLKEIQ
jgi:16S rRNA A1518/A1519 N6-dimethyltransferase RsmA/KsgA/DIM1 with predicted DNA glycosylase/AP lyase activity